MELTYNEILLSVSVDKITETLSVVVKHKYMQLEELEDKEAAEVVEIMENIAKDKVKWCKINSTVKENPFLLAKRPA